VNFQYFSLLICTREDIQMWSLETGKLQFILNDFVPKHDFISAFTLMASHRSCFVGTECGGLRVFELRTGTWSEKLQQHGAAVSSVVHAPRGELLLSSSYDGCVYVHADRTAPTGEYTWYRKINFKESIRFLHYLEADSFILIGTDDEPMLWDVQRVGLVAQLKDLALMKQGEDPRASTAFPQGDILAIAFFPTGHMVAGDQKGRVALFSPRQNAGETPRILKVYTNSRMIEVLNEDEDDWLHATIQKKVFVAVTALLPLVDIGGTESEIVKDLGPIAKKCRQMRPVIASGPKTKASSLSDDEDAEPEPQLTPEDMIDGFFNNGNAQNVIHHVQINMENQLSIDLPKADDGPSAGLRADDEVDKQKSTTDGAPDADESKKPSSTHLVIGDDHGRVRVIKLPFHKSSLKTVPQRTKMHPYAGDVDISLAVLKKAEKDRQEKKHLYYEEVKETEPKIVLEWEAHPHSAVTHLEEVVGVNGLLTCGEDAYVRMWNCDVGSKHAGECLLSIDTKKRFAHSWSIPTVMSQSYLLMVQGYRVLERIYGEVSWEKRSRAIFEARSRAALSAPSPDKKIRDPESKPRVVVQKQITMKQGENIDVDPWKKVQKEGRFFKMMDLEEISELERIAKEEHDQSLKVAQMITPNKWQPKNVEIEMTQKPLDPYASFERKPIDSPTPEHVTTIRGALSLIDREGGSMENLPGAFRMPLPLALNSVEEAAQQDRISRKQRRKFSAKAHGEARMSLGVPQLSDAAPIQQKQHHSTPSRVSDDIKPVKCTAMYQTFELSQSMQDFHRSYKRQLNHSNKRLDSSNVFGSTATSMMSQSMTNFSSTRSADRFSGSGSQPDKNARDKGDRSRATRSVPTLGTPSTGSRQSDNPTDHKSFNAVSGRDHALSGRDVRFRLGEGQKVMMRSTRYVKSPM
jgi:hypothetical protein